MDDTLEPPVSVSRDVVTPGTLESAPPVDPRRRFTTGIYLLVALVLALLRMFLVDRVGPFVHLDRPIVERTLLAAVLVAGVVAVTRALDDYVIDRIASTAARYNLKRVASLLRAILIGLVAVSTLFATWYTALVSLGIVSLILGFALQTPITSFIGWIYILVKNPYRVGDRIRVGESTGDVIDVSFLDTIVWEIGGPLVSTDDPSGRIIRIPNSLALGNAVYNCTTARFPYVWNEVKLLIAYGSDVQFVATTMQTAAARFVTPELRERLASFRRAVVRSPIDPRALHDKPTVVFRSHESSWLEAVVRYLVDPRDATAAKDGITREVLRVFAEAPDRVSLPSGAER